MTGFRIGQDIKLEATYGPPPWKDLFDALRQTKEAGLEGVNVRTLYEVSPTLDRALLADAAELARELDLYLELGVGKVNPYMTAEYPHIRALGEGGYLEGMRRLVLAAAEMGVTELWTATGGFKPRYRGLHATDRFRAEAPWPDQLAATAALLHRLAPVLRDTGVHLNLETHEEITTFELVRLVEDVGPDVLGICFDSANVAVRGEDPMAAVRRVAPYVRSTQLRDAALCFTADGISRFLAPCGEGVIDWALLLGELADRAPVRNLTIEAIGGLRAEMTLHPYDDAWRAGHPDLTVAELAGLFRLTRVYEASGRPGLEELRHGTQPTFAGFTAACAAHLRTVLTERETRP
ncbi:sugar phosphate isomerase/epimerase [Actinocorallia herbida]|uniref:Sugar phosphate isomerase/epimerase n=1 Tax=Actinocorallia herbida TaxID=58109 RepID=A0A3N1D0F1_9ACTN|nr:TIM barrel protein [Actinocorallia herbida]ROO86994.1 sugar phosphate isomerase/epimerase [Actinocorallia herbida]